MRSQGIPRRFHGAWPVPRRSRAPDQQPSRPHPRQMCGGADRGSVDSRSCSRIVRLQKPLGGCVGTKTPMWSSAVEGAPGFGGRRPLTRRWSKRSLVSRRREGFGSRDGGARQGASEAGWRLQLTAEHAAGGGRLPRGSWPGARQIRGCLTIDQPRRSWTLVVKRGSTRFMSSAAAPTGAGERGSRGRWAKARARVIRDSDDPMGARDVKTVADDGERNLPDFTRPKGPDEIGYPDAAARS